MGQDGLSRADETRGIPLFPLPDFALFPNTLAPFHVFDPSNREMLEACLSGRRLLVIAGLRPGWERAPLATPAVFDVAGLGRVISDRRLSGGRYDLFVHGLARVRIVRCGETVPCRRVDVERLPDGYDDPPQALAAACARVFSLASNLARRLGPAGGALSKLLAAADDPAVLSFRLASLAVDDATHRQHLLELTSPLRRLQLIGEALAARLMEASPADEAGARWIN